MKKLILTLALSSLVSGCAALGESKLTDSINSMTDQINKFADNAGSGSLWFNPSRVTASGEFQQGQISISIRESQVLTKAQIDPILRRLNNAAYLAGQTGDHSQRRAALRVHKEMDRGLWTANDVIIFAITNTSDTYEMPISKINYLLLDKTSGKPQKRFKPSLSTLEYMNENLYLVDSKTGDKIRYLSRVMDPIAPLETAYLAVIQTRLKSGQYEAVLNNVPIKFGERETQAAKAAFSVTKGG